jgi:hypothetical protein
MSTVLSLQALPLQHAAVQPRGDDWSTISNHC